MAADDDDDDEEEVGGPASVLDTKATEEEGERLVSEALKVRPIVW
jgi:hypothetical protein